jgi:hypothetical protein
VPGKARQVKGTLKKQGAKVYSVYPDWRQGLRAADEVEYRDGILDIILSPSFATAAERCNAMGAVVGRIGSRVNPRYSRKIKEISNLNLQALGSWARFKWAWGA